MFSWKKLRKGIKTSSILLWDKVHKLMRKWYVPGDGLAFYKSVYYWSSNLLYVNLKWIVSDLKVLRISDQMTWFTSEFVIL